MKPLPAPRKAAGAFCGSPAPFPSPGARTIADGIAGDCAGEPNSARIAQAITVAEWPRGNGQVRVRLDSYNGRDIIDIREWYRDGAGELRPGKKGIAMSTGRLPDLARALAEAVRLYQGDAND